jgi:hypothetical protein
VQVAALQALVRRLVVQGAAATGPDRRRRFRQLPLSGREHPHVSDQETLAAMMTRGGFSRVTVRAEPVRRHRGDPRGVAAMSGLAGKRVLLIISGGIAAFKARN